MSASPPQGRVYCDHLVRERLLPESLALANDIVAEIKRHASKQQPRAADDGVGLLVQLLDRGALHEALALSSSPVSQAPDADASVAAFWDWLVQSALETPLVGQTIRIVSSQRPTTRDPLVVAFARLSLEDANAVVYRQWQQPKWIHELRASGIAQFALVLCIAPGDCSTMYEPVQVFD